MISRRNTKKVQGEIIDFMVFCRGLAFFLGQNKKILLRYGFSDTFNNSYPTGERYE